MSAALLEIDRVHGGYGGQTVLHDVSLNLTEAGPVTIIERIHDLIVSSCNAGAIHTGQFDWRGRADEPELDEEILETYLGA